LKEEKNPFRGPKSGDEKKTVDDEYNDNEPPQTSMPAEVEASQKHQNPHPPQAATEKPRIRGLDDYVPLFYNANETDYLHYDFSFSEHYRYEINIKIFSDWFSFAIFVLMIYFDTK
jgi:hypothetical protein